MDNTIHSTKILCICGVKNSGKTTLLERLIPMLCEKGIKVAVLKHDGHEFEPDVPNTDSYRLRLAGAYGTAVYSSNRYLLYKEEKVSEKQLFEHFKDADLILCEGMKHSLYPKIEIVRGEISKEPICNQKNMLALVTDLPLFFETVPTIALNDLKGLLDLVLMWMQKGSEDPL